MYFLFFSLPSLLSHSLGPFLLTLFIYSSPDLLFPSPFFPTHEIFCPVHLPTRGCKSLMAYQIRVVVCSVSYSSFSVFLLCLGFMWCIGSLFLVVSSSAVDILERFVSKMTYYVSSGTLNPTHALIHSPWNLPVSLSCYLFYVFLCVLCARLIIGLMAAVVVNYSASSNGERVCDVGSRLWYTVPSFQSFLV